MSPYLLSHNLYSSIKKTSNVNLEVLPTAPVLIETTAINPTPISVLRKVDIAVLEAVVIALITEVVKLALTFSHFIMSVERKVKNSKVDVTDKKPSRGASISTGSNFKVLTSNSWNKSNTNKINEPPQPQPKSKHEPEVKLNLVFPFQKCRAHIACTVGSTSIRKIS